MPAPKFPIEIDPVELQNDLQERMKRYLLTALPIHRRFPLLREQAQDALSHSSVLVKGPYLEALPDFPKGRSLQDLVNEGKLHEGLAEIENGVYARPLHIHQQEAIEEVALKKNNIVVATGTGSGKTECFLYPLAHELLQEDLKDKNGIRAIIVYPMNALANDQLDSRVVPLFIKELSAHGITVGRYTGQTTPGKGREFFEVDYLAKPQIKSLFGDSIPETWRLSRQEMLDNPPHVLITNYAMLEHLLLLPQNAPLFSGADLRFLILDELHTYAGAQASEVAFLLRKLCHRYAPNNEIQCIGTSASLGRSEKDKKDVIKFASRLFGFPFTKVVTAVREPHHFLNLTDEDISLTSSDWIKLHEILHNVRNLSVEKNKIEFWNNAVIDADIEEMKFLIEDDKADLSSVLCRLLARDHNVRKVSDILAKGLISVDALADQIFPSNPDGRKALTGLIAIAAYARESKHSFPLIPARYHLFTRGIEEATIELSNENDEHACNLRFKREFKDPDTGTPRFRLMTCRKCGELYFEAYEQGNRIVPEHSPKWRRSVFWLKPKDSYVIPADTTEVQLEDSKKPRRIFIQLETGELKDVLDDGDDPRLWLETCRAKMTMPSQADLDANMEAPPRLNECQSCGSRDRSEIITPFHPGDQALSTNIAEVLYTHLPTLNDEVKRSSLPGHGRNLLVFSDNRQDAAFFAPYFQRSHEEILLRRAIVLALQGGGSTSLSNLGANLANSKYYLNKGLTDRDGNRIRSRDLSGIITGKLFAEFCTPGGSRSSLEDLAIVTVEYVGGNLDEVAKKCGIPHEIGGKLIRWILDSIRLNRAISMPSGIDAADDFYWGVYSQRNRSYTLEHKCDEASFRILPSLKSDGQPYLNRFVEVLRDKLGLVNWRQLLIDIWNELSLEDDDSEPFLISGADTHLIKVLDHRSIFVKLRDVSKPVYRCNKCSKVSSYSIGGKCTQWNCNGEMELVEAEDWLAEVKRNHYHFLYKKLNNMPSVIAKEHTASIGTKLREEIETNFKSGKINLLSSSTTMEMGIDLGDLEGVFLRNAPPGIANYQQRAGRAGRRAQAAPVSITYLRNRRYDQDVFTRAEEFLKKEPETPFVHLGNARIFQRHQFSILMSRYLAYKRRVRPGLQIGELFGLPRFKEEHGQLVAETGGIPPFSKTDESNVVNDIGNWLNSQNSDDAKTLASDLFENIKNDLSASEKSHIEQVHLSLESSFIEEMTKLAKVFGERYRHYMDTSDRLYQEGQGNPSQMRNRAYRWANQRIVNFLSKYGIIPTYSFPVDSIDLDITQAGYGQRKDIELSRDARMGITEYAPGAEVIANGRLWTSYAIAQHPREFMPPFKYKICNECRNIEVAEDSSSIPSHCSSCGATLNSAERTFIEPRGFITAAHEADGREPRNRRELPPQAMETQLIGNAPEKLFQGSDLFRVEWALQNAQEGRMVVINRGLGQGFVKCKCGYSHVRTNLRPIVQAHKNPYTQRECNNTPSGWRFDLAHTFHTDVLQIRCKQTIPEPILNSENPSPEELEKAREGIARSICESLRLAASKMLNIPEREISSTFRWLSNRNVEVILFDNIPGGAGYCSKIKEQSAVNLFSYAENEILDCPDQCSSSCSKCLRSYSNQAHWDSFRRIEAKTWVHQILQVKRQDPRISLGAEEIKEQGIKDLIQASNRIVIFRDRLGDFTGFPESDEMGREKPIKDFYPEWNKINLWLAEGKQIRVVCRQFPAFNDPALPLARRFSELLLPYIRSGNLSFITSNTYEEGIDNNVSPSMLLYSNTEAYVLYHIDHSPEVMESIYDDPMLVRNLPIVEAQAFEPKTRIMGADEFERPDSIRYHHSKAYEKCELSKVFEFLNGKSPTRLEIEDRYLVASETAISALKDFLKELSSVWEKVPDEIVLTYGPSPQQRDYQEWRLRVDRIIRELKKDTIFTGCEFRNNLRGKTRVRNFHDRRVKIAIKETIAARRRNQRTREFKYDYTAELTGGIAILMDKAQETSVFVFETVREVK